ncbi:MAG: ADOP family duplicated permease [Terriglobales bacterium]
MKIGRGSFGSSLAWTMVILMALGVGATTAMFSVVNGVLLKPLDLPHPGQLVILGETVPQQPASSAKFAYFDSPAAYSAWTQRASDFTGLSALQSSTAALTGSGTPQLLYGARVTSNFFSVLQVRPVLGRAFVPADATATTHPMIITDRLWRGQFGADPGVVGRVVGAPGHQATIVGVLPPSFKLGGGSLGPMLEGEPTQFFQAFRIDPKEESRDTIFTDFNYHVIGRLRPGVTPAMALAQLNAIQANLARKAHQGLGLGATVTTVLDHTVSAAKQQLWLLMGGVLAVLLVVCVNLGGLWVTRIADRRRDWAIRTALGAAPGRLVRQVLGESVLLAVIGGLLGIACAALSLRFLVASAPADIPRLDQVHLDWRVLLFGLALSVLAGLITGLVPALRLSRADPQSYLKASGAATTADRSSLRSRQGLIALQAALSTLLLAGAGLLGLSFYKLIHQPTGFSAQHAVAADVVLTAYNDTQRFRIFQRLGTVAAAIPGVTASGETSHLPLRGETWIDDASVPGRTYAPGQQPSINVRFVSPGYFAAVGIPLLRGRDFTASDNANSHPQPVILARATAVLLWPEDARDPESAVGRPFLANGQPAQVAGVVGDVRAALKSKPPAIAYITLAGGFPIGHVEVVARGPMPTAALEAELRRSIAGAAPLAPIPKIGPLANLTSEAVAPQQYQLTLLLLFAVMALVLAAIGVYALVSHSVARRSKELAIRITMGAGGGDIWGLVVRQALAPVIAGVIAGLIVAVAAGRLLASMLFDVSPASPPVLAAVALAVLLAALAACLWPAHRATRTNPLGALRSE